MAKGFYNRGRGRNQGHQPSYHHQHSGRQGGKTNTNPYAALDPQPSGDFDGQEMNSHLMERFDGARFSEPAQTDGDSIPRPLPELPNDDIREYFTPKDPPIVGGSWLEKPEFPTPAEIMDGPTGSVKGKGKIIDVEEDLRPNKIEGAYESNEEYLGTQYDLLREDAIRPLREAVAEVRASPFKNEADYTGASIGLYEPVYITSIIFSNRGLATRVAFSLGRVKKLVRWDQSKRLITGTLVALTPAHDMFKTKCVLATVAARPLAALNQNPPEIDLFFARPEDMEIDPMVKWVMVESRSSFYEASRHTMLALQHMMREPFPLSEHLVKVQGRVEPPKYVQKNPYTDMSSLVAMEEDAFRNVNILKDWPDNSTHGLDKSQSQALKRILTSQLAVIQGPPGTGKTYVSVVALKLMISNMGRDDPPILVTCQTNHALDQLLRHVSEFEENFIRLGGRSKDKDKIKKRTLFEVRQGFSTAQQNRGRDNRPFTEMKQLTATMQVLLSPLESNKPPLDHRLLQDFGLLTEEQARSLEMNMISVMGMAPDSPGIQMEQWLGKKLVPCDRPIQPDDCGLEFEEEDFEVEQLQELEAEAVAEDDDFESLRGNITLLSDNHTGLKGTLRGDNEIRQLLGRTPDLTTIPARERGAVYNYFQRQTKRLICEQFRKVAKKYNKIVIQRKVALWEQDLKILRTQRLVGLTTTGLSKYRGLVAGLRPRIVVVEEAAETLEAPVTAACLPSLEHLILVGDHQQLRPRCQVREFEDEPFHFNLSLFERMVINKVEIDCLTKQRRMIPEIRRLLAPIYGDTLKDHPSVTVEKNRPPVEGMWLNSYFFTHEWQESTDGNMSAINEKEADMVVAFFDYLLLNGVDPGKITILTFYNGQRKCILKKLRNNANTRCIPVNVVTVDSYQGEENDIVLLSLVRSNQRNKIGFLSVDNRVCVALSRAKRGFYVFGNAEMLALESETWANVVEIMSGQLDLKGTDLRTRRVGYQFPLKCTNHGYKLWMEVPEDFELINGGCYEKCGCKLPCGHNCMLRCHPFENAQINCTQKCNKRLDTCGHPCVAMCCDPCKCQICDRRNDGMRPMLKPSAVQGARSRKPAQQLLPDFAMLTEPTPPPTGLATSSGEPSDRSGSSINQWQAYANGGSKVDDAEISRKMREGDAKARGSPSIVTESPTKLIRVTPTKASTSKPKDTNLLIDFDGDVAGSSKPTGPVRFHTTQTISYAGAVAKKENKPAASLSLLD